MRSIRPILQRPAVQALLCWLAAQYVRLVRATGRWRVVGEELPDRLLAEGTPFIIAFWHGRLLMMAYAWKRRDLVHVLISGHRDGRLIAGMMRHFGSKTVFGSTRRGGAAAFVSLVRLLRRGKVVGITPDGPRGPRMRASKGIVALARAGGAPILPVTFSASRLHLFASWDRFALPFPFSRGVFLWGAPIHVPSDASEAELESKRVELEQALNDLTRRADARMGRPAVEPAAPVAVGDMN